MFKTVSWKWLCDEEVTGKYIILFNHIHIINGQWDGYMWHIAKTKKNLNIYIGRYLISIVKPDYKTYFKDCQIEIISEY